jgi:hypothetical protein
MVWSYFFESGAQELVPAWRAAFAASMIVVLLGVGAVDEIDSLKRHGFVVTASVTAPNERFSWYSFVLLHAVVTVAREITVGVNVV